MTTPPAAPPEGCTSIEPFAGTMAASWRALGHRPLMTYQGSKDRFHRPITDLMQRLGGPVTSAYGTDPGMWGQANRDVADALTRRLVLTDLRDMADLDPREVFDALTGTARVFPSGTVGGTAEFLFLQRLAYAGKLVRVEPTPYPCSWMWQSPGFNTTSAYGTPSTPRFGGVKPQVPALIRRLAALDGNVPLSSSRAPAEGALVWGRAHPGRVVYYLDPPYLHTTDYGSDMPPYDVVDLARQALAQPNTAGVIVSEAYPVRALVEEGWQVVALAGESGTQALFKSRLPEHLTWARGPAAVEA